MATDKYADWSTPILSGLSAGLGLAQSKKEQNTKKDWEMFSTGISLMKNKESLPDGMKEFMNNYMSKNHGITGGFEDYKSEDNIKLNLSQAQQIIKNAESVYGNQFLKDEKTLNNFLTSNVKKDGSLKINKEELEGYIDTYYSNFLKNLSEGKKDDTKQKLDNFNDTMKLRKEFDKLSGEFVDVTSSYNRILASADDPSAAGDIALIFNYMKMLDARSTVRESEYATAANAGSIPNRIWGLYNKILAGKPLAPDMRADFVKRGGMLYEKRKNTQQLNIDRFSKIAEEYGLNPEYVIQKIQQIDNNLESNDTESLAQAMSFKNVSEDVKSIFNGGI